MPQHQRGRAQQIWSFSNTHTSARRLSRLRHRVGARGKPSSCFSLKITNGLLKQSSWEYFVVKSGRFWVVKWMIICAKKFSPLDTFFLLYNFLNQQLFEGATHAANDRRRRRKRKFSSVVDDDFFLLLVWLREKGNSISLRSGVTVSGLIKVTIV